MWFPPQLHSLVCWFPVKFHSKPVRLRIHFFFHLLSTFTSPSMDLSVLPHFWDCNCATRLGQEKNKEHCFTWGGLLYCGFFSGSQSIGKCLYVGVSSGPATRLRGMGMRFFCLFVCFWLQWPPPWAVWRVSGMCRENSSSSGARYTCFGNCWYRWTSEEI